MTNTTYIWQADQSEPGLHGSRYAATSNATPPVPVERVRSDNGLVYAESVYDDWRLIGTAKGDCYTNDYGNFVEMQTPGMGGAPVDVAEVVRLGWYSAV